jgi:NADH pyrophosphatase NudC (nudix superfamily)
VVDTLIKIVLALLVVGFVAYPLLREQTGDEESLDLPEDLEDLYRRKESAYSALKELEFDYKTGKLSEGDFRELEARYRAEALELLAAIDEAEKARTTAGRRKGGAAVRAEASAPAPVESADLEPYECAACGRMNIEGARFCAGCGGPLEVDDDIVEEEPELVVGENVCAECGSEVSPDHRFCGSCGAEVEV